MTAERPHDFTEEHWCIFDATTGEILATETIWTQEGTQRTGSGTSEHLLQQFTADSADRTAMVDAIEVDHRPLADERVDVVHRVLVKRSPAVGPEVLLPCMFRRP